MAPDILRFLTELSIFLKELFILLKEPLHWLFLCVGVLACVGAVFLTNDQCDECRNRPPRLRLLHYFKKMTSKAEPINLLRGWPCPKLLPNHLIQRAAKSVLSDPAIYTPALLYGPDPGYEPLRESIAAWLNSFFHPITGDVTSKRICITGGASQNLGCLLNVYSDPEYTRNVWIVAPAYFLAFRIFEDAGFGEKMRAVPEDEEGLDISYLRREIGKSEEAAKKNGVERPRFKPDRKRAKVYKHIIYCVPTFANPSSRTMTLARRQELVRLAREFDALLVSDDVYDFLQWHADSSKSNKSDVEVMKTAHLPRLVDVDRDLDSGAERQGADGFGNACSNGSFSKLIGPGVRVGWCEGTEKFAYGVSQTGTTCSGGAPSQLTSTYIHELLKHSPTLGTSQIQHYINTKLIPAYSKRYNLLTHAISTHLLPLGFSLPQSNRAVIGGYFTWLTLPEKLKTAAEVLAKRCREEEGVVVAAGKIFEVPGDEGVKFEGNLRLCWSWEEEERLEEGVRRVGVVARRMLEEVDSGRGSGEDFVVVEKGGGDGVEEFK